MITFTIAMITLLIGYFIYGKFIERLFGADSSRITPAIAKADGVDYVEMPTWKIFMIQFLNIAGLGPIFGAIMGAKFGTSSFLWIVFGTIFAGSVHDYLSGMISLRRNGESLPQLIGGLLGKKVKKVMILFIMILMILVGAVFVSQPADLLNNMTPPTLNVYFWIVLIFAYYFIATLFPIDKIIGKLYPIFGAALLFMALGIMVVLYIKQPDLPEVWNGFGVKYESNPIFPMMFISIACGAISGFHATQSPLMARCLKNEKHGRPVFYGAMIAEGIVALVWAAAATAYFQDHGPDHAPGQVVMDISRNWLGILGGTLAVLGVIAAPITSGDTALRSAFLILSDMLHINHTKTKNRILLCLPIFFLTFCVLVFSITNKNGFSIIWRYFSWCNQLLATITLWAITVYLTQKGKLFWVTLLPALFMTVVASTYILVAPEGFKLNATLSTIIGISICVGALCTFLYWKRRYKTDNKCHKEDEEVA